MGSVPVTSMNRSLGVFSNARQIAVDDGREGEHLIVRIHDEWITLAALQDMAVILSLGMLMQHLLHGHLFGEVQGHELASRDLRQSSGRAA